MCSLLPKTMKIPSNKKKNSKINKNEEITKKNKNRGGRTTLGTWSHPESLVGGLATIPKYWAWFSTP
jgi:hypothetical protein